ncbi:DUF4349 domain-containing protein [Candidatus Poriferisodalis sp.]|uniref:DUF4349 domain-containing protein n=1 Tax=Candidatus Poriferisodalis sp. TaxID=3101277 RepID=UPI003B522A09
MTVPSNRFRQGLRRRVSRQRETASHHLLRIGIMTLALLFVAAACSASDDEDADTDDSVSASERALVESQSSDDSADASTSSREFGDATSASILDEEMMEVMEDEMMESDEMMAEESVSGALATGVAAAPADFGRDIIRTARIAVETADVAAAAARANSIIEGLGGFAFSQETSTRGRARTMLTFKIRPEQFATALERLSNVGELVEQTVSAEDVTDIVVDLNSRIRTAEISVNRLRDFLSQATEVKGVAELERELANRETNLERLRGQLRSLRDRVDLSTITLSITESVEAVPSTAVVLRAWMAAGDEDPCLGFTDLVAAPHGEVGFCFELENEGETALTEVSLSSNELRFNTDDLTVPEGTDLERIAPGERAVATLALPITDGRIAGRVATRGLEINVGLSAVPVTDTGAELARLSRSHALSLYVEEEDTPPGFGDAFSGGWNALVAIGSGVLLVIGAMLAFLPVIVIAVAVALWWLRRRRARRSTASGAEPQG